MIAEIKAQNIFLLTWNPGKFQWMDYPGICEYTKVIGPLRTDWSTCSRQMVEGDRFFLLMQGKGDKNGIVGTGIFVPENELNSEDHLLTFHPKARRGWYVNILLERLVNYKEEDYPHTDLLQYLMPGQCWRPQGSGISVKDEYKEKLIDVWNKTVNVRVENYG